VNSIVIVMNTDTFIRHYTRKILAEARVRKRLGGISRGAREALGLADTNPAELLKRLGFPTDGGKMTLKEVIENFADNRTVALAFEDPTALSNKAVEIYIRVLDSESEEDEDEDGKRSSTNLSPIDRAAISPYQAPRYVKATINAAAKLKILDIDPSKVDYQVFEEDGEKFLVRVEVR